MNSQNKKINNIRKKLLRAKSKNKVFEKSSKKKPKQDKEFKGEIDPDKSEGEVEVESPQKEQENPNEPPNDDQSDDLLDKEENDGSSDEGELSESEFVKEFKSRRRNMEEICGQIKAEDQASEPSEGE